MAFTARCVGCLRRHCGSSFRCWPLLWVRERCCRSVNSLRASATVLKIRVLFCPVWRVPFIPWSWRHPRCGSTQGPTLAVRVQEEHAAALAHEETRRCAVELQVQEALEQLAVMEQESMLAAVRHEEATRSLHAERQLREAAALEKEEVLPCLPIQLV